MLIEFRVENYRSFKDEQTFSFVASKDDKHINNLISCDDMNLLKAAAIYGHNGSGKSNLIKALRFVKKFVSTSATKINLGDQISNVTPFRLDKETCEEPSTFEITAIVDDIKYTYGFSTSEERVYAEWLIAYPPPYYKKQTWLERFYNPETQETRWAFRGPIKSEQKILKEKTRDNGLVLSRGAELNIKPLIPLFLWIRNNLWVFDLSRPPIHLLQETAAKIRNDKHLEDRISKILQHADLGIEGLSIDEEPPSSSQFPEELKALFSEVGLTALSSSKKLSIHSLHKMMNSDRMEKFDFENDESNGTQRIFALAGPLLDALDNGNIVVVDELECSMHPLLTRKLLELFQNKEVNKKGAQILFATQDVTLMDSELFRRDQIWLIEKNANNASELYSLYDFKEKPRKTEVFQKNYLAGRYGGIGKFGPIFEDFEIE